MQQIQCKITGRVQGVFFRVYAKEIADNFNIVGFAKNTSDGGVEIIAQHFNEDYLKYFISKLKEGSALSKIDKVDTVWMPQEKEYEHFIIK